MVVACTSRGLSKSKGEIEANVLWNLLGASEEFEGAH
jgi:hypothetical protein